MFLPETLENVLDAARETTNKSRYFNDPVLWAKEVPGYTLWSKQKEISGQVQRERNVAIKAGHGVGKLLVKSEQIPTPTGWVLAGEVEQGDFVLDEMGKPTKVTAKTPVWDVDEYTITFDDGTKIRAGAQHEWNVLDISRRTAAMKRGVQDWRDFWDSTFQIETQELYEMGTVTNNGQNRWRIPLTSPLQMPSKDLPIDPYLLGLWLGDGSSREGLLHLGYPKFDALPHIKRAGYSIRVKNLPHKNMNLVKVHSLTDQLKDLGVLNNKHIPMEYLRASEGQRRALLAGLMDTDGFLMKGSMVGIDMTNKTLSEDIYELLMTLGCKVFWKEGVAAYTLDGERHVTGTRYRMNWTPLENPFRVRGHEWTEPTRQRSRHTQRTIVRIEKTGRVQNYCIQVDSPRNLYLAGKSFVPTHNSLWVSLLICWWIDTRYPDAFVVSTAPSNKQIGAIVWREIRRVRSAIEQRYRDGVVGHRLPGYITADNEWKDDSGGIIGFGRKPPDQEVGDMIQGIHAAYVLAVGDEAVGLSKDMIEALANITSNEYSRRVLIANPTNPYCHFADIFLDPIEVEKNIWSTNTISVLDSPNYTDEKHTMPPEALAALTGLQYEEDMRIQHGEDSAMYRSRVLGEFDRDSDEPYLIREEDIANAEDTDLDVPADEMTILGVDIARFGKDISVIYKNQGGKVRYVAHAAHETRATEVANWIHFHAKEQNASEVRIDGAGIGGPVGDILLTFQDRKYRLIFLNPSATPPEPLRHFNMRAYWWSNFKDGLQEGRIDLDVDDPEYKVLKPELLEIRYKFHQSSGAMMIESKDDMAKRGVKSPDFGDAAVFAGMQDHEYANEIKQNREVKHQDPSELLELGSIDGDYYLDLF